MVEHVIRDIPYPAQSASTIQVVLEVRLDAGPHLDASTIAGVAHRNVVDVEVLNNVRLALVLTQRADADAVRTVADEVLHYNVGAVGLEGDTV